MEILTHDSNFGSICCDHANTSFRVQIFQFQIYAQPSNLYMSQLLKYVVVLRTILVINDGQVWKSSSVTKIGCENLTSVK